MDVHPSGWIRRPSSPCASTMQRVCVTASSTSRRRTACDFRVGSESKPTVGRSGVSTSRHLLHRLRDRRVSKRPHDHAARLRHLSRDSKSLAARRNPTLRSVEETHPRKGLSVPVVTVVDEHGALIESDQRALVRYVIQEGNGADVVFAAGTTGEWDRVTNDIRQRVIEVCAEEVAAANRQLAGRVERDVEMWAGITAPSPE